MLPLPLTLQFTFKQANPTQNKSCVEPGSTCIYQSKCYILVGVVEELAYILSEKERLCVPENEIGPSEATEWCFVR